MARLFMTIVRVITLSVRTRCPPSYRDATERNGCGTTGRPLVGGLEEVCAAALAVLPDRGDKRKEANYRIQVCARQEGG